MRIATWNVERSGTQHRSRVPTQQAYLESLASDIYVLTECHDRFALTGCHGPIMSTPGQAPYKPADRAVGIWSKWPVLRSLETTDGSLSACAEIDSPLGPLIVYGTILPYHAAGKPEASHWQRHREALGQQIEDWHRLRVGHPKHMMCVAGDFNMNLDGRKWYGDQASRARLLAALDGLGLRCVTTADWQQTVARSSIDHICITANLAVSGDASAWPGTIGGRRLSDHNGVMVDLVAVGSPEDAIQSDLLRHFHALIRSART